MKQLLFLFISFISIIISPAICHSRNYEPTVVIHLQKIDMTDVELQDIISNIIVSHPKSFWPGEWYIIDFLKSSVEGNDFFRLDILEYDKTRLPTDKTLAYYFEVDGVYFAAPKEIPSDIYSISIGEKTLKLNEDQVYSIGASYAYFISRRRIEGKSHYSIWIKTRYGE